MNSMDWLLRLLLATLKKSNIVSVDSLMSVKTAYPMYDSASDSTNRGEPAIAVPILRF